MSTSNPSVDLQEIGDIFNLSPHDFINGNKEILNVLLHYNLLWSGIFLSAIWMLWDTVSYYFPQVKRVPFICSLFSLVWFTSSLLLTIIIYGSANNIVVRIFGFIFIVLLACSFVLGIYRVGAGFALYCAHKSILIASRGPIVVAIGGMYFSSDFVPAAIAIKTCGGRHHYQGSLVGSGSITDLSISVYSGRTVYPYTVNERNGIKNKSVTAGGEPCLTSIFLPETKTDA